MEPSFDLDINNYTSEDLMNFFKLGNTFSLEELAKKEYELATSILSVDNKKYIAISAPFDEVGKMLGGWYGQLSKQNSPIKGEK